MDAKTRQTTSTLKLSMATATGLALAKLATGVLTHSMSILASALDSAMDVGVSLVNLIAAREAAKPPDEDHAYGHGKIESLAALFQGLFISASGLFVIFEAAKRLILGSFLIDFPYHHGLESAKFDCKLALIESPKSSLSFA